MPYREFIPDPVRDKINSWDLSPYLLRALWETLKTELRTRPDNDMRLVVAPVRCLIFRIRLADPIAGGLRDFGFYVDKWVRPGERTLIDAVDLSAPFFRNVDPDEEGEHPQRPDFV